MKKIIILLSIVNLNLYSQSSDSSKFGFGAEFGFCNAQLYNSNFGKVNGNVLNIANKFIFRVNDRLNLSTGVAFVYFNGNVLSNNITQNLNNQYFQIPMNATFTAPFFKGITENIRYVLGIGGYGNYLFESTLSSSTTNVTDKELGWNFGLNANVGLRFKIRPKADLNFLYDINADLSELEKNGVKQKMTYIAGLKLNLTYKF